MTYNQPNESAIIPFHGAALLVKEVDGVKWIAVKPICEHLGIDWKNQHAKLGSDGRFNCGDITMLAEDGKQRVMTCLDMNDLLGWLYTINASKIKVESRPRLTAYQKETTKAINDYWTTGRATRPNVAPPALHDPSLLGREALRGILQEFDSQAARLDTIESRLNAAPIQGEKLGAVYEAARALGRCMGDYGKAWRLFKEHFGLASYRDLPSSKFDEAMRFLRLQVASYGETCLTD